MKNGHKYPEWSDPKKNPKLIKIGKGSSTSHPGQGLFRQIRSYIIHDMAGPNAFYLSQLNGKKLNLPVNGKLLNDNI
jgi:hypothetical protein